MEKLIPVVVQDVETNNVLMVAYMNRRALALTRKTGWMHYWSRSRNALWRKGATSGHTQKLVSLHGDCDRDTLLARVRQTGVACHLGRYSCFSARRFRAGAIEALFEIFRERKRRPPRGSYTAKLLKDPGLLKKKVLEEAGELVLANKRREVIHEAADLLYHALLYVFSRHVGFEDVEGELRARSRPRRRPSRS